MQSRTGRGRWGMPLLSDDYIIIDVLCYFYLFFVDFVLKTSRILQGEHHHSFLVLPPSFTVCGLRESRCTTIINLGTQNIPLPPPRKKSCMACVCLQGFPHSLEHAHSYHTPSTCTTLTYHTLTFEQARTLYSKHKLLW